MKLTDFRFAVVIALIMYLCYLVPAAPPADSRVDDWHPGWSHRVVPAPVNDLLRVEQAWNSILPPAEPPIEAEATAPTLPPVWPSAENWTRADTERLVKEFDLPKVMVRIAGCESNHYPKAHRSDRAKWRYSGDLGLWQINYIWQDTLKRLGVIEHPSDLFLPLVNARAAEVVLEEQGLAAWNPSRYCWRG